MSAPASALRLCGAGRDYGRGEGLAPTDLDVRRGETLVVLGPSGSGKSTLLRLVGGFETPDVGRVLIGGTDVTATPPERRPTAMVFQNHALWPHLTVADNIAFGLRVRRRPRAVVAARVRELLELVRLPDIAARRPGELSGGQRQRVALARALAVEPELLLLDEPLSALDARLRDELREELRRLLRRLGATALYVTHDHTDALELGDRVAVIRAGRIEQIDVPESVYERPGSRFVARFCGDAVLLDAVPAGSGAATLPDGTRLRVAGGDPAGTAVAVRPEALTVGTGPDGPEQGLPGRVVERRYAQGRTRLLVRTAGGDLPVLTDLGGPPEGAEVVVGVPAQRCWLVGDG